MKTKNGEKKMSRRRRLVFGAAAAALCVWGRFLTSNVAAVRGDWATLASLLKDASNNGAVLLFSVAWLIGQLCLIKPFHKHLADVRVRHTPLFRFAMPAVFYATVFTALAPRSWLEFLGPRLDAVLMMTAALCLGVLYNELYCGVMIVALVMALYGLMIAMFLGVPLMLVYAFLYGDKNIPIAIMAPTLICAGAPLLGMGAPIAAIVIYIAALGVVLLGLPMPELRDAVFALYRHVLLVALPVYGAGLWFTDRTVLRKFTLLNLPFLFGPESDAVMAGQGGSAGGAGAGGGF